MRQSMGDRVLVNYLLLLCLGVIWGAQFLFVKIAIADISPALVAAGRIVIGALTLVLIVWLARRLGDANVTDAPPATGRLWGRFFLIGLFEATLPFFLIAWGQQHIHSGIAAILLGTVPVFTLVLSAIFVPGEGLRLGSVVAVLFGLAGVAVIVGPHALTGVVADIAGELALLGASLSFAIAYVLVKRLPHFPLLLKARNMLICAAVQIVVAVLVIGHSWKLQLSLDSVLSVLVLGAICSGIVFIPFVALIQRAGATFTSLNNSLVPPVGLFLGVVFLSEPLGWKAGVATLLVVLALAAMAMPGRSATRTPVR